jgi:Ca2+-binding EF-hand superfamily protein
MAEALRKLLRDERQLNAVATNAFNEADSDKSGFIDEKELTKVLTKVISALNFPKPSSSQIKEVLSSIDKNKDGKVSIQEFLILLKGVIQLTIQKLENNSNPPPNPPETEESKKLEALKKLLKDERQLNTVSGNAFADADTDKSSFIDEKELSKVLTKVSSALNFPKPSTSQIKEVLSSIDRNKDGKVSVQEFVVLVKGIIQLSIQKLEHPENDSKKSEKVEKAEKAEKVEAQVDKQLQLFEKYLQETGISLAFQIIYTEIITKKIDADNVFTYTAMRLRQIGKEVAHLLPENLAANISENH